MAAFKNRRTPKAATLKYPPRRRSQAGRKSSKGKEQGTTSPQPQLPKLSAQQSTLSQHFNIIMLALFVIFTICMVENMVQYFDILHLNSRIPALILVSQILNEGQIYILHYMDFERTEQAHLDWLKVHIKRLSLVPRHLWCLKFMIRGVS